MNPSPNLFLIGPMGAGKSSIGRRLAAHFGMPCVDLDATIEARTGASVATIFELEGEAGFRRREAKALDELTQREGIVLATGGGAVLAPENRERLHARGFVVWLQTSVAQQLERLAHDRQRPLLGATDRGARLAQLAAERDPLYAALADLAVASGSEPCQRAAARVAAELAARWQRTAPAGPAT